MSLPHDATADVIRLHTRRAVLPEDAECCSDTLATEEMEAVGLCIGIGLTALAPNGRRYGGDGDGPEGVEGKLACALRF